MDHPSRNKFSRPTKFCFINGLSVHLQLPLLIDHWTNMLDKGTHLDVSCIFINLRNASNFVPEVRL